MCQVFGFQVFASVMADIGRRNCEAQPAAALLKECCSRTRLLSLKLMPDIKTEGNQALPAKDL